MDLPLGPHGMWLRAAGRGGSEKCANAKYVVVVEMNMGQILNEVKMAVDHPEKVFLANRVDGVFITDLDIRNILRLIRGKGV